MSGVRALVTAPPGRRGRAGRRARSGRAEAPPPAGTQGLHFDGDANLAAALDGWRCHFTARGLDLALRWCRHRARRRPTASTAGAVRQLVFRWAAPGSAPGDQASPRGARRLRGVAASWFHAERDREHYLARMIRDEDSIVTANRQGRVGFVDADDIAASPCRRCSTRSGGAELVLTDPRR